MNQRVKSKEHVLKVMARLGMQDKLAEAALKLPDPVDLDRDKALLSKLGLSFDELIDELGGSAW